MRSDGRRVTDDAGVEFTLGARIAKGGQGEVYRVEGLPDYAIKLLTRPEELVGIEAVRRLPLDGLSVAPPITLIRQGGSGYVMRLAGEMTPLREPYLPQEFGPNETASWYLSTGGLRRRLAIAARVADTVTSLHALALAYVDLNPNNVMISEDLSRDETWLIDTDNLTSMSTPTGNILGLHGYIAPERMLRQMPASTLADAYSLAVLTFRLLVLNHPLMGVATHVLDAKTANEQVDRGELAYVADPGDDSNHLPPGSLSGALLPLVLSGRLQQLCARTFGPGRLNPAHRPGSARWREVLFTALDNVITCPSGCGWSYYRTLAACPSCGGATGSTFLVTVYGGDYEQPGPARDSVALGRQSPTAVLPRHAWGRYDTKDPLVSFLPDAKGFTVETHGDVKAVDSSGKAVTFLRTPQPGEVHRVILRAPALPERTLALRAVAPA